MPTAQPTTQQKTPPKTLKNPVLPQRTAPLIRKRRLTLHQTTALRATLQTHRQIQKLLRPARNHRVPQQTLIQMTQAARAAQTPVTQTKRMPASANS